MTAHAPASLRRSLAVQGRVIHALAMREIITRFGRHNIGFMWLFVEPMLFTLGIVAMWSATRTLHASKLPIVPFALTGYSAVLLWRNAASRCAKAIEPNRALLFHRNVRVLDLFLARLLLEISGATLSFAALGGLFWAAGWIDAPDDPLTLLAGWALLSWFASALGLVVGSISERWEVIDRLWHTATYLLFPLSGAVFMVDWLPAAAQGLVLWLPMVHATEMLRDGYFGNLAVTHYSVGYQLVCNLVLSLFGLALVRDVAQRIEGES